jgi:AcrR family transcriptional regulator
MNRTGDKPGSKRDQLIDTALKLFARHGYRATGIDTILKEAGIAKMTLYHHFKSKDELIEAALRRRDQEWRAWFKAKVEQRAAGARARLLAIFDVLEEWFRRKDYHGCSFSRAATEYRDPRHAIHELAAEHKRIVHGYVTSLAAEAGANEPAKLADQLCVLVDGAVINMEVFHKPAVARSAKTAAEQLVRGAIED